VKSQLVNQLIYIIVSIQRKEPHTGKNESTQRQKKPKEYPQQPETKTVAKHAMSEVCLLPGPSYSRGWAW